MKAFCVIFFIIITQNILAQSCPIIHYDKLQWGTVTIENLLKSYPDIGKLYAETADGAENFTHDIFDGDIEWTNFNFYKNKLATLTIQYGHHDENGIENILSKIQQMYGKFDKFSEESDVPVGYSHYDYKHYFRYYNENLHIYVRISTMKGFGKTEVTCELFDPISQLEQLYGY